MPVSGTAQRLAWGLSLAGLVPFIALTVALYVLPDATYRQYAALVLATYGAVILSFLGGTRWGAALHGEGPAGATFALSMVPPLLGWFALAAPLPGPFLIQAAGFALHGVWDAKAARDGKLPDWFGRLRMTLSIIVTAILLLASTATLYGAA